jgi:hypothetical protein
LALKPEEASFAETPVTLNDTESYSKCSFKIDKPTDFADLSHLLMFVTVHLREMFMNIFVLLSARRNRVLTAVRDVVSPTASPNEHQLC